MKTTMLAAAIMAAISMPAFAEDAPKTDDASTMSLVDPATTSATTTDRGDMTTTTVRKSGCMHGKTALQMM